MSKKEPKRLCPMRLCGDGELQECTSGCAWFVSSIKLDSLVVGDETTLVETENGECSIVIIGGRA
jgi:hypothetical protein